MAASVYDKQIPPNFLAPTPLVKDIYNIIGSTINASTLHTQTINTSTVSGNAIHTNTLQCNTLIGSTIQTDTLTTSTIVGSTIQVNTLVSPIIQGSTIQTNTAYYNTLVGSTISTTNLQVASLTGSTIQTNTLGLFDYDKLSSVQGEYITIDLGTGGNYHNRFTQQAQAWTWANKIHFLGSNDGINWINLGLYVGTISNNIQTFNYTLTNRRYIRLVIIEIYNVSVAKQINFLSCTISNNGGTTLFPIVMSAISVSPNTTQSITSDNTSQVIVNNNDIYTPVTEQTTGYYTGTFSTIYAIPIRNQTAILALTASTLDTNTLQANTLRGSSIQAGVLQISTITGSTIQANAFTASTIFGSTMQLDIVQVSTLYVSGVASTIATGDTIQVNLLLFNTLSGSTIQANTFKGSTITASTMKMNQFSIETLSGDTIAINILNVNTLIGSTIIGNTIQASTMNIRSTLVGSTIQTNVLHGSSIIGSTIQINTLQVSTLFGNGFLGNAIQVSQLNTSSLSMSSIQTNVLQVSTIVGSTIQSNTLRVSTILGNTIQMDLLHTSSIIGSTIQTNILDVSTVLGSTIQFNTIQASTIMGSTIRTGSYIASSITGSTIQTNTLLTSIVIGSSIIASTVQTLRMNVSTIIGSTMIGSNFQTNKILITDGNKALITSATNATQLQYLTNLISQAGGIGQENMWTSTQTYSVPPILNGLTTGSPSYILGLNASNQLIQFTDASFLSGTLTTNYIPYAITNTSFDNSIIYRVNATDIAIGQTTSAFPTSGIFNYIDVQKTYGDYFTFDLGTAGNYHNLFSTVGAGLTTSYQIHFFGSDNNTAWISLGIATATNSDGSGNYNYTLSNKRYLRLVIIKIYNMSITGIMFVAFYNPSISYDGGANLFTDINQISLSPNITPGDWWAINTIKLSNVQYARNGSRVLGTYTGTTFTTISTPKTGPATVTVNGLTQTTNINATTGTFSKIFMGDKRTGLNGTLIPGNKGCNFYMGTMNNNSSGNISDVLYLNSWGDTSAGNMNIVMFDKNGIAMRIFQGGVGAIANFTTYIDALLTDTNSGNIIIGKGSDTNGITFGPNTSWSSYLKIGSGNNRVSTTTAQVITTNGDLHLNSGSDTRGIYLNFYVKDSAGISINSYTPMTHNNALTVIGNISSSSSIQTDDWYYINNAYGMYWTAYGRGIVSPEQAGNTYGNVSTWNTGKDGWSGWGIGNIASFIIGSVTEANTYGIRVTSPRDKWMIKCFGNSTRVTNISEKVRCSQDWDRIIVWDTLDTPASGYFYVNQQQGWGTISDERIKKNIISIDPHQSIAFINEVNPSYFCLKESEKNPQYDADGKEIGQSSGVDTCEQAGFIAQNILESTKTTGLPLSNIHNWYEYEQELLLPEEERKSLLGVNEMPLISHLVNALKAKMQKWKEQQEQISKLQYKLEMSKNIVNTIRETVRQQTELLQQLMPKT